MSVLILSQWVCLYTCPKVQATPSKALTGINVSLFPWLQVLEESLVYQMTPEVAFTPSEILREKKKDVQVRELRVGMCDCMTYMYGSYSERVSLSNVW